MLRVCLVLTSLIATSATDTEKCQTGSRMEGSPRGDWLFVYLCLPQLSHLLLIGQDTLLLFPLCPSCFDMNCAVVRFSFDKIAFPGFDLAIHHAVIIQIQIRDNLFTAQCHLPTTSSRVNLRNEPGMALESWSMRKDSKRFNGTLSPILLSHLTRRTVCRLFLGARCLFMEGRRSRFFFGRIFGYVFWI